MSRVKAQKRVADYRRLGWSAALLLGWSQAIRSGALGMIPIEQTKTGTSRQTPGFLDYVNSAVGVAKAIKGVP